MKLWGGFGLSGSSGEHRGVALVARSAPSARPLLSARCRSLSLLTEREYPIRLV